ncbi:MAG: phasin family protein [Proteobacteria bacterium]|uniref:phasin family protein n=1 Tax=Rudaea sp. TaxID=2136325 RepID=UPI00321FD045|nr:phasin family protein [Pseudomonadota bacterium]
MNKPKFDNSPGSNRFPSVPAWNPFAAVSGPLEGWTGYVSRLQNEVLAFAQTRFRREIDAMERFARCRKPEEYVDAQATFLAQTYSDYAKENLKLAGMLGEAAQSARKKFAEADVRAS